MGNLIAKLAPDGSFPHHNLRNRMSSRLRRRRSAPSITRNPPSEDDILRSASRPLSYAAPFLLRLNVASSAATASMDSDEKYVFADTSAKRTKFPCKYGDITQTSIVTFHGPTGETWNRDEDARKNNNHLYDHDQESRDLRQVNVGDVVTVYANISEEDWYLQASGSGLAFSASLEDVRSGKEQCQFIVRRSPGARGSLGGPGSARGSTQDPAQPAAIDPAHAPTVNDPAHAPTAIDPAHAPTVIDPVAQVSSPTPDSASTAQHEPGTPSSLTPSEADSPQSMPSSASESSTRSDSDEEPVIQTFESVTLECKARPGWFVCASLSSSKRGSVFLSSFPPDQVSFQIREPQLKDLVKLNDSQLLSETHPKKDRVSVASDTGESLVPLSAEEAAKEARWIQLLASLPNDVVYLIISFKGHWLRTARLVCRDWCTAAELHIGKIRVNGEFADISTRKQRRELIEFVKRCRNLQSLTLRNIDNLSDNDMQILHDLESENLSKLVVGGCRRLSDGSVQTISKLKTLKHLNLAATSITDEALALLSETLHGLEILNLYACQNITHCGVRQVAKIRKLSSVNLRGTEVDKSAADAVQRNYPDLQVFTGPLIADSIY